MKFFTYLLCCIGLATTAMAQTDAPFILFTDDASPVVTSDVVISEIMYNPPETGTDSLEYIELYNRSNQSVNLLGYTFSAGITYTFTTAYNLAPGAYVVVAADSAAVERNFGIPAFRFVSGGLSNSGERIEIRDANGTIVDSLRYDEIAPWPTAANGGGSSLVLCDVDADNALASNWAAANTPSGFTINGVPVFANPGAASQCATGPSVGFLTTGFEADETQGTVSISVSFSGGGLENYSVQVSLDAGSSATLGADYTYSPTTLTLPAGIIADTQIVTVTLINDNQPETLEHAIFRLTMPDDGLTVDGPRSSYDLSIVDDDTDIANIVITEIFYNAPGADDPYEYIELYNNDDQPVSLLGYYFTQGIEDTIPNIVLMPGDFLIVAKDSASFQTTFGQPATQWATGGSLNNTGEDIELRDPAGNVVDLVDYRNAAPWPTGANGNGNSLVLCDVDADNNNAANWADATQSSGAVVNGVAVFGSPGAANNCQPAPPVTYPSYTIGQITGFNATSGVADSVGIRAQIEATVYGLNLRPSGLQFTLIDASNNGVAVFSNSANFGYTVAEGDRVVARGVLAQFNGLTQLNLDTVYRVSANNPLVNPTVITGLSEATESQLVKVLNVTLVDPAQWTNTGSGFNVDVQDLNGNIIAVRIDADVDIFGSPAPQGRFNVTGIGGQFDATNPYLEGYQLLPRYQDDIELITSTQEASWAADTRVYPNPATDQLLYVDMPLTCTRALVVDVLGRPCLSQTPASAQFSLPVAQLPAGVYTLVLQAEGGLAYRKFVKP